MTSNDYILRLNTLELSLRELIAENKSQIAEMKALNAHFQQNNSEFREQLTNALFAFKEDNRKEFEKVHTEISALQSDIRVQNTRIDDLIHWNYWLIAFMVAFFTLPSIAEGLKSLLKALATSITSMLKNKSKKDRQD